MQDIAHLRREYRRATLDVANVDNDPIKQFGKWFDEALSSEVIEPNAMHLATVNEKGRPSSRIVLLKSVFENGFVFYTNYQSRKGKELENNPACSLTFFWPELERQVRIEGVASRVDEAMSEAYFQSRPRESQLGAWASPQSTFVKDRAVLEERFAEIEKRFSALEVLPRPKQWGGYRVEPLQIEFWQGGPRRLHDRVQYTRTDSDWHVARLAP